LAQDAALGLQSVCATLPPLSGWLFCCRASVSERPGALVLSLVPLVMADTQVPVSYGFDKHSFKVATKVSSPATALKKESSLAGPRINSARDGDADRCVGLGYGIGGQLVRSALGTTGASLLDTPDPLIKLSPGKRTRRKPRGHVGTTALAAEAQCSSAGKCGRGLLDGPEPQGMYIGLLLGDAGSVDEKELARLMEHRWNFQGSVDFASRGRGFCFFVRCLLDLQRNIQVEEEGAGLDPKLARACKIFVNGQCNKGQMGYMYHLLTHFVSNSVVFDEWGKYIKEAFDSPRANQESFLVPHLEQVWGRFCRLVEVLEDVFDVLNSRYVCRHRLPKIGDLVREHMKRRCFGSDEVSRNELLSQEKCTNATVKAVKFSFGIHC